MNLAAAGESPTRVGANLAVAGANLAVVGANLAVVGANLAVAGANLAVAGVSLAVAGVNLAVAGVNLAVAGVNLAVAGVNLAVAGVNLAVAGVNLAVAGVNLAGVGVSLAVAGVSLAGVRLNQAGAGMEPTTACLCLEASSKPAPTTSTSLEIVADLRRVSCLLPEMATDLVDVGRLPCLPTKLFAGSAGILPAFFSLLRPSQWSPNFFSPAVTPSASLLPAGGRGQVAKAV